MTTIRTLCWLTMVALCWTFPGLTVAEQKAQDEVEFSEAETRLWMTDQLRSISAPLKLTYEFRKSGSLEAGFSDRVVFDVERVNEDGTKAASLTFFTGERSFPVPPVADTTVNPILKVYLQGDVYEMNRLSDPEGTARERWRYFQRRIKFALAEAALVEAHQFEFDGRVWHGHKIQFQPYKNDPKREQFEAYAEKIYTVIVSDDLPGYIYRIETIVPAQTGDEPLVREVLQLSNVSNGVAQSGP
jgi:hypothetical protein